MCDGISSREKRDGRRDEEFYVNASFITKKSFLHFIKGYPRQEYVPSWPKPHGCVYPKANAYYAFNEDANPFARFTGKCQSRKYGNVQPHYESPKEPYATRDPYRETEATQKYLQTKPTCFAVFGKPGLNLAELAAMIADAWNCVLISPQHLVNQEIEQGTEKGKIIADILKSGERLGPDVITSLVENRIGKRDVLHRGYVVEGLPLIPNETLDYSSYDRNSNADDENLAQNYARLHGSSFQRICSTPGDLEQCQRPAISSDQEFKDNACAVRPNYEDFIYSQVEEIFTTWPIKPSIVIYATCPDADVARKRERLRIDAATGRIVDTSFLGKGKGTETMFSDDKTGNDANVSLEFHRKFAREEDILDDHQRKYLLKRPCDGKSNVEAQCKLYKRFAMPAIEKWTLLHKPENVIRVDGRVPVSRMFQITVSRLRLLPIPRMILPKRSMDPAAVKFNDESPPTIPVNEFEDKSNEEAFRYLMNRETVSPMYPWRLSSWNFLCPVELARGKTVEGVSKYAVRFMNNMFFLSSEEAMELFLENPRTFLLPFAPRPTCKMAVFGPKYSGKSDLCKKLARVFRGTIVDSKETDSYSFSDFSTYTDVEEDARVIIKKIQDIPKEEIDIDVWRDGGYIVDGIYPDLKTWRTIVEDQKIVFEDAILLFDEEPYEYLISKWDSIHKVKQESRDEMEGECMHYSEGTTDANEDEEEEEETRGLADYLRHIRQFELDWEDAKETIAKSCKSLIACNVGKIDDVSEYVIENIKVRYADKARIMSDEEKEREKDLAEYMAMADTTEIAGEEDEAEGEGRAAESDVKEDNRPFGDTNYYCPVALLRYNVFWKGKEDFSAIFMNRIYLLSGATALEEFVRSPQVFSLPFRKPLSAIPPLRVSIIGPTGSGKSTVADAISREYGLVHVDYFNNFATYTKDRQMFPLSRRGVLISSTDLSEEVELPEDLDDRRYSTDAATVQTFVRRYWKEGGVLPKKMLRECLLEFFEGHYNLHGVVLDQFPSCPQDVEAAIKHYAIPEIIIELQCGRAKARERMIPELLKLWQDVMEEKKRVEYLRYTVALSDYESDAETWIQKMLRETIDELRMGEGERFSYSYEDGEGDDSSDSSDSSFGVDSEIIENRRLELDEQWRRENPEPVLFTDWEDFETARDRIEEKFEEMYEVDAEMIVATRTALEDESIPYVAIDGERDIKEILLQIMRILTPYAKRDVSVLEKTYTADLETAEMLLDCGYYLQSSFGRWCPVQLRENVIPLQMFLPLEARQEIYPVIHRQFVYFLGGKDARSAFLKNPLSYIEQDSCAPVVPFRLSIIGPPKCGKTTLARRFATEYGIKMVSRGAALRHLLKHFPWTESAESTESVLRAGHLAPEEFLHRAVEMYSVDPRSTSQGVVLDGFPVNRKEYEALTFLGVQPMVVLDLKANLAFCLECLSREADETKKPLNFSDRFLAHRYETWNVERDNYREWLGKFTQNVIEIDATRSTWHVWTRADREVCSRYAKIRSYFRESDYDKPHSLTFMNVSPYEFKQRQSRFESYCPLCLFHEDIMKTSGPPSNHRGMVQFREHFYWICPRHMDDFVKNPEKHLPPINTACLPEDRPRVLTEEVDVQHPCWAKRLRVDGFCLVTYADNLPSRRLVPGKSSIGVLYKDKVYLFCTEECRDRFLTSSEKYSNVDIKFLKTLAPIDVKDLPNLGFLEQTVAKVIVEAVNQVSVIRPKLPGLSSSATAAIFIGVYLKTRNVSCAMKETKIYDEVSHRMFGRDKIFKVAIRAIKKKLNPFVSGPEYQDDDDDMDPSRISRHLSMLSHVYKRPSVFITFRRTSPTQMFVDPTRRVPVPDARYDYLCEYFKPVSKVPAFLNVVDIAGLVKGAAEGQGLGNSFLSHINACDGIFHLCRAFDDDDVTHIEGDVNPVRDLEIISEELRLKDIEFLNGHLEKLEKLVVRGNDKKLKPEYDTLLKVKGVMVDEKRHIRFADWSATDIEVLNKYLFLTSKPVIYLVNLSEKDYIRKKNKWLIKIKEWVDKNDPGAVLIPFSGAFENKLVDMNEAERAKYLEEQKATSALDKIIIQGYKALQLQYFFTAGHDEVKAWTIQKGTKAPQAAGKIHTDFEKGFIMAEVMKYDDFKNEGSEAAVKAAGKYRQQGRNYVVEDGDIIFFKFNAGAGLKDAKKK